MPTALQKVSVVIPTLNEEEHLSACLDALTQVDYPKEQLEIIIVDNGSTDATHEISRKYTRNVFVQAKGTVAALRNFGAEKATGDILAFVDADCLVAKDWLRNAALYFNQLNVVAWGAPPEIPDDPTWVQKTWSYVRQKSRTVQESEWLESMNLFVRQTDYWKIGGFNEKLITCEDVDFGYRIRQQGQVISDSRIGVVHLGEADTLSAFLRKELWRGKGNLQGIFSHGISRRELPSLSIPFYFGLFLPLLAVGCLALGRPDGLLAIGLLYLLPTLMVLARVFRKRRETSFGDGLRLSLLLQVYFAARTLGVFRIAGF